MTFSEVCSMLGCLSFESSVSGSTTKRAEIIRSVFGFPNTHFFVCLNDNNHCFVNTIVFVVVAIIFCMGTGF